MSTKVRKVKNESFTTVNNEIIFRKDISLKAKAIFMTMMALPDTWNYSIEGLSSLVKEGPRAVRSGLDELKKVGYLVVKRITDEKGRVKDWDYTIYQTLDLNPEVRFAHVDNPHVDNPDVENSAILNTNLSNTDVLNTNEIEKKDINSSDDSFISKEKPAKTDKEPQGIRPTREEVEAFIRERGYHINYQDMDDYYTDYGKYPFWMMISQKKAGKEPPFVKSWKGCCKTFEDNWKRRNGDKPAHAEEKPFNQFETDWDDPELQRARKKQMERAAERRRLRSEQQPAV